MDSEKLTIYVFSENAKMAEKLLSEYQVVILNLESELLIEKSITCYIDLDTQQQDQLLSRIHQSEHGWTWTVYVKSHSELSEYLCDGLLSQQKISNTAAKLSLLSKTPADKLLAYLWLNENRKLKPKRDRYSDSIYSYPLLNLYHHAQKTPFIYLAKQLESNNFAESKFVDRVRYCRQCNSGHLNYIETCPSCFSPNIKEQLSLHCFTCGHVADKKKFIHQSGLTCPNCLTHLKHIGVDYDRPLEMFVCLDCNHDFIEAKTKASCLSCDHLSDISELIMRNLLEYKKGENAHFLLVHGGNSHISHISLSGNVDKPIFQAMLSWRNQLSIRHKQEDLLIALKFKNIAPFLNAYGEIALIELINQLSENLDLIFRDSDISCQYSDDSVLILLPMTGKASLPVLQKRLTDTIEKIEYEHIYLQIKVWSLPDPSLPEDNAQWLAEKMSVF
ncbi:hypothetical protein [Psychromonas sp.]|uniref:TackOD1 domain-containing metal-binding protein n=1 Tax=Psychromonas sp. TaxID=1884585 RepID=UPI003564700F